MPPSRMATTSSRIFRMKDGFNGDSEQTDQEVVKQQKFKDTYGKEFNLPDFTMKDILEAIPAECFNRSAARGLGYVLRDLLLIASTCLAAQYTIPRLPSLALRFLGWITYGFIQGCFATGIWVLAHECGHQAFSPSRKLNDFVGWVLHSSLLVPYFSWQITHGKHHKATGHLSKDMVLIPKTLSSLIIRRGGDPSQFLSDNHEITEEQESKLHDLIEEAPLVSLYVFIRQQTLGWLGYLTLNLTGQKYPNRSKWTVNHFNPTSPFFSEAQYNKVLLSDVGVALTFIALALASKKWGFLTIIRLYVLPYFWVNHWLVLITYIQHTDPALPHYREGAWNFQRGAAATMDRDFGFIGQHLFHDILKTHVAHHYCSYIPFYQGREATKAIRTVMGDHYSHDETNIFIAAWRSTRMCQYVDDVGDVVFFQNANGLGNQPHFAGEKMGLCIDLLKLNTDQ